jgi:Cu(I)/Ag(I) efflux system membrane fusion protein
MSMLSTLRYRLWASLDGFGAHVRPLLNRLVTLLQKQLFIAVVLLATAVGFRYYVLGSDDDMTASAEPRKDRARSTPVNAAPPDDEAVMVAEVMSDEAPARETALEHAKKHLDPAYVCPMHSNIVSNDPNANCPICGMKLVPVETGGEAETVTVAPGVINMLGVRTEQVKKRTLYRRIESVGYVSVDENRIRQIALRTEGWIEKLMVKTVGERVKQGDLLFEVYSPKLVNAQEEFLTAIDSGNSDLVSASFGRLRSLGISAEQVTALESSRKVEQFIKYYAPQDGVVAELAVREGGFVEPAAPVVNLVDLSTVWLLVSVFERQADWVKVGNKAEANLSYMPEQVWEGTVDYIYPNLDPKTRSLLVRVRFDNSGEALKPNMYADVKIFASPKHEALSVPREAIIRTGDSDRVILALGDGRFKPVNVRTGMETGDRVEIMAGLDEGADVVVSSQFLIDSESSLRAALLRMNGI